MFRSATTRRSWAYSSFITILQSKGVDIYDDWLLSCELNGLLDVSEILSLFASRHQNVQRLRRETAAELIIKIHIGDIERYVLFGIQLKDLWSSSWLICGSTMFLTMTE